MTTTNLDKAISVQTSVNALNDLDTLELGRWIKMHVMRVGAEIPVELVTTRKRRHIAPRAVEVTKEDAQTLIKILQHGLDRNLPGTITFVLYGREEL
jgi:hypothetical protein